jgi:hypothetical protein
MSINARQFQNLQAEACRMAEELPPAQLFNSLVAAYEAGRLLRMTRGALTGLLGSVVLRCIDAAVDEAARPAPAAAGLWPRLVVAAAYDEDGSLIITGLDDNDHPWRETASGRGQEAWLLKQLYIERRYGRRRSKPGAGKKGAAK